MKIAGWTCWESARWTRQGYGKQQNSNIDIVMTHLINKKDIEIVFKEKLDISDHVPIQVILKHEDWEWKELKLEKKVKNKKFMREVSKEVLRRLYLSEGIRETRRAFEYRQRIRTRWNVIKPRSVVEEIKEIDTKTDQ